MCIGSPNKHDSISIMIYVTIVADNNDENGIVCFHSFLFFSSLFCSNDKRARNKKDWQITMCVWYMYTLLLFVHISKESILRQYIFTKYRLSPMSRII